MFDSEDMSQFLTANEQVWRAFAWNKLQSKVLSKLSAGDKTEHSGSNPVSLSQITSLLQNKNKRSTVDNGD